VRHEIVSHAWLMALFAFWSGGCEGVYTSQTGGTSSGGSSSTGGMSGGCDAGLCAGTCCPSGTECRTDADGGRACETICHQRGDCAGATPCCAPVFEPTSGAYAEHGDCEVAMSPQLCICAGTADCNALFPGLGYECAPYATDVLVGPYVCAPDNGLELDGCAAPGDPSNRCSTSPTLACSTDKAGNQFCSLICTIDADCRNVGVACCNGRCGNGQLCCGLCGS
jgi:hypothetical protein